METRSDLMMSRRQELEGLFQKHGYTDFTWIDPGKTIAFSKTVDGFKRPGFLSIRSRREANVLQAK